MTAKQSHDSQSLKANMIVINVITNQGGITCGAIDEPRISSKAIDKRVIINFCNKNAVIARFRNKNEVFVLLPPKLQRRELVF